MLSKYVNGFGVFAKMPRHVAQRLVTCLDARPESVRALAGQGTCQMPGGPEARAQRRLHRIMAKMAQLELQPNSFYFI